MSQANTKDTAYKDLCNRIVTMQIEPGAPIDEVELAGELGISRTPLREIIQRLGGEGYLVIEKNRGAKVAPLDLGALTNFFQAAPMIYAAVSRLAAERASKADIDRLKELQRDYRQSLEADDASLTAMHNHDFHRTIGIIANSPYLMPSLERLLIDHTRIGQTFYNSATSRDRSRISKAAEQHDAMIDAIEAHEPALAVKLTLDHWELSKNSLERFVRPDPLAFELGGAADAV